MGSNVANQGRQQAVWARDLHCASVLTPVFQEQPQLRLAEGAEGTGEAAAARSDEIVARDMVWECERLLVVGTKEEPVAAFSASPAAWRLARRWQVGSCLQASHFFELA